MKRKGLSGEDAKVEIGPLCPEKDGIIPVKVDIIPWPDIMDSEQWTNT